MKPFVVIVISAVMMHAAATYAEESNNSGYVPGLGEIMGATQMRHSKLWFAGKAGNWELAAYELDEIREGLDDATRYHPDFKGAPIAALLDKFIARPIADLNAAVTAKDEKQFRKSFDELTSACNNCHQSADKEYIVIKRPGALQYNNQEFSGSKK